MVSSLSLDDWPVNDLNEGRVNPRLAWPLTDQSTLAKDKGPIITPVHYAPILNAMQLLTLYLAREVRFR